MKLLPFLLLCSSTLCAQFVNKNVIANATMPSNVKSFTRTEVDYEVSMDDTIYESTYVTVQNYNSKGELEYIRNTKNDELTYEMRKYVRDKGRTVAWHYDGEDRWYDSIVNTLDDKGNIITNSQYLKNGMVTKNRYEYDNAKNLTLHQFNKGDSIVTYRYAYSNSGLKLKESDYYRLNGQSDKNNILFKEKTFEYDERGLNVLELHKNFENGQWTSNDSVLYTYDDHKRITERVSVYNNGERFYSYNYTYDDKGNLIKEESEAVEPDYADEMTETWEYDEHGYWTGYTQVTAYDELHDSYKTQYNAQGLPVSCVYFGLGTLAKVTWTYEYR